jgi:hypothetical protein
VSWRFLAARVLTGEVLAWDLPLSDVALSRRLSGPQSLSGSISPAVVADLANTLHTDGLPILDPVSTMVYAEESGIVRGGGVLWAPTRQGPTYTVDASGFTSLLHRQILEREFSYVQADPLDIVRDLIAHVQSLPDAGFGITVDDTTSPLRLGTPPEQVEFTTGEGEDVSFEAGPHKYVPWETPNVGEEIDELAGSDPGFDYLEHDFWARETVAHRLRLGYPRLGRRRTDLLFDSDVNIAGDEPQISDGDRYANHLIGVGKGSGRTMLTSSIPRRDGRPRVMAVEQFKHLGSKALLDKVTRTRAATRAVMSSVQSVTVRDHPSAPLGSWEIGDDVLVTVRGDWGTVTQWSRVVGDTWRPDSPDVATLDLVPSGLFAYGAT